MLKKIYNKPMIETIFFDSGEIMDISAFANFTIEASESTQSSWVSKEL